MNNAPTIAELAKNLAAGIAPTLIEATKAINAVKVPAEPFFFDPFTDCRVTTSANYAWMYYAPGLRLSREGWALIREPKLADAPLHQFLYNSDDRNVVAP